MKKTATNTKTIRCAIYTRKSVDEGLDQEINSLTVQREAAEAYIASQKGEGWVCLPKQYDDGGFSGANLKRPGLQRLLDDIEAGEIDCVVVYKVDRLSRSLLDFAKISDRFSQHEVAFVSVTQQINTGTSMGKLMLGILISFAQFERETIAERTRDRMASARRKGRWVGGRPPLGYDVDAEAHALKVNETEAIQVKEIFSLYLELASLSQTVVTLNQRGYRMKEWVTQKGRICGGGRFSKSSLHGLLKNRSYIGEVLYRGEIYPANHPPIVEESIFTKAQQQLDKNDMTHGQRVRNKHHALLRGLLTCEQCGTAMSHTYSRKKSGKVYRYYVCQRAMKESWHVCPTKSVSAGEIEAFVVEHLKSIGRNPDIQQGVIQALMDRQKAKLREAIGKKKRLEQEHAVLANRMQEAVVRGETSTVLAHLGEQIAANEEAFNSASRDLQKLEKTKLNKRQILEALSRFEPVWNKLHTHERCELIQAMIERIAYDGTTEQLEIFWKDAGVHALGEGFGNDQ